MGTVLFTSEKTVSGTDRKLIRQQFQVTFHKVFPTTPKVIVSFWLVETKEEVAFRAYTIGVTRILAEIVLQKNVGELVGGSWIACV